MVRKIPFGVMPDGTAVEQYTLEAGALSCDILTYGGALRALRAPGRARTVDVLLGFDTLEDYRRQDKYLGALIGRYANRIGGSAFSLENQTYPLAANDGPNHLHGGRLGFDKQVWTAEEATDHSLTLSLTSPDGQEGYPGTLTVRVTYTLTPEGLRIRYQAESSRATPCNLTNHAYFNLSGHASGPVLDQTIQILADFYTPSDAASIPTGQLAPVEGTPMDLRQPTVIGAGIDGDFQQLRNAGGYDHNWAVNGPAGTLRPAARAFSPATGISLEVWTTLPGVQFYSGNYLDGCPAGKDGARYGKRWAFCLETQLFPDTPHHANFPACILRPGEVWDHTTELRFHLAE
ncbi:MAG: galactose mutarotase [Oscillibacter sp.]|nr:galactose mutarotase [Oscillibacter sp.]